MRVLVIEDDSRAAEFLRVGLAPEGYEITIEADGRAGLILAVSTPFDLLIIDRMLPGLDGLSLVRTLRAANVHTPAIFLTALGGIDDRVDGLRAGGDDYLVKPFELAELSARVAGVLRRSKTVPEITVLRVADLELNRLTRSVRRANQNVELKAREFKLLEYLMLHAGQVVTRTMLLESVWDFHFDPQTSVVESHVSRLRSKINRGGGTELIQTLRGSGYRLADDIA